MPIGVCPQCQSRFVIEDERSYQRTCPCCLLPMQVAPPGEISAARQRREEQGSERARAASDRLYCNGVPLAADERGQRLLAAIAEAAYQRQQAAARRGEARRLLAETKGAAPPPFPRCDAASPPPGPDQGARGGGVIADPRLRAVDLCRRAAAVQARVRETQIRARMVCGAARMRREDWHASRSPEAALPPSRNWDRRSGRTARCSVGGCASAR